MSNATIAQKEPDLRLSFVIMKQYDFDSNAKLRMRQGPDGPFMTVEKVHADGSAVKFRRKVK